jgi:hypothetical protein
MPIIAFGSGSGHLRPEICVQQYFRPTTFASREESCVLRPRAISIRMNAEGEGEYKLQLYE